MGSPIHVFDDVVRAPLEYRAQALDAPFRTVELGPAVFHGVTEYPGGEFQAFVAERFPMLEPTFSMVRQSPAGQEEPNFIHTDLDMGQWTGILYLTLQPARGDGTTFWRRKSTDSVTSTAKDATDLTQEWLAWRDFTEWEPWATIDAKLNRAIFFPAHYFHSRALYDNYGEMGTSARLIQILFGQGILPEAV